MVGNKNKINKVVEEYILILCVKCFVEKLAVLFTKVKKCVLKERTNFKRTYKKLDPSTLNFDYFNSKIGRAPGTTVYFKKRNGCSVATMNVFSWWGSGWFNINLDSQIWVNQNAVISSWRLLFS